MSEESDSGWQTIAKKGKKRKKISKNNDNKRASIEGQVNTNSFAELSTEEEDDETPVNKNAQKAPESPNPPPIFIPNVKNITKMRNEFEAIISSDYKYKTQSDGQIKVMVTNIKSYKNIITFLETNKIEFHTYQPKQERAFRVVLKNLHSSTSIADIKQELLTLGHDARNIVNVKSRFTKEPLPLFFVDLEPKENNKNIYELKHLLNAIVKIEAPHRNYDLVQCHRCQQFGHTKSYCRKPFSCVKCGLNHSTAECKKEKTTPPKCIHCLKNHTANYKGCQIYQELLKKNKSTRNINGNITQNRPATNYTGTDRADNNNFNKGASYSSVLKGQENFVHNEFGNKLEILINKQIEMTNTLINMMSTLISKLCK